MLLLARPYIDDDYDDIIKDTLRYLISIQTADGNFPVSEAWPEADQVQFCHGAPGAIQPFVKAYELYGDPKYL